MLMLSPFNVHSLIYLGGFTCVTIQHLYSRSLGLFLFAIFVLPSPIHLPKEERVHRAITCFTSGFYFCRMLQINTRTKKDTSNNRPLWLKLSHVFGTFMNTKTIKKVGPLDLNERNHCIKNLKSGGFHLFLISILFPFIQLFLSEITLPMNLAAATICSGIVSLLFLTAFGEILIGAWGILLEVRLPWLMREPAMSISLREFWGRRWNGVIQRLLKTKVYDQCLRCCSNGTNINEKSRTFASVSTFMVSGVIHAYPVFIASTTTWNDIIDSTVMWPVLLSLSYFIVQVIFMLVQDQYTPKTLSPVKRRIITIFGVVFPSPLLIIVFLTLPYSTKVLSAVNFTASSIEFLTTWTFLSIAVSIIVSVTAQYIYNRREGKMPSFSPPDIAPIAGDGLCGYRSIAYYYYKLTTNQHVKDVVSIMYDMKTQLNERKKLKLLHHTNDPNSWCNSKRKAAIYINTLLQESNKTNTRLYKSAKSHLIDGTVVWSNPSTILSMIKISMLGWIQNVSDGGSDGDLKRPVIIEMYQSNEKLNENTKVYFCYTDRTHVHITLNGISLRVAFLLIEEYSLQPPVIFRFKPLHWTLLETTTNEIKLYVNRQKNSLIESTKLNIEKVVYPKRHSPRRIGKFIKSAIRFTSYMRSGLEEEVVEEEEVEEEEVEEVVVEAEKVVEEEIEKSTSRMQSRRSKSRRRRRVEKTKM